MLGGASAVLACSLITDLSSLQDGGVLPDSSVDAAGDSLPSTDGGAKADGTLCTSPQECVSGLCTTFLPDTDGDGFGNPAAPAHVCGAAPPAGYVLSTYVDCCDSDKAAHPGQTNFYPTKNGCGTFDYDCNGSGDPKYTGGFGGCTYMAMCAADAGASDSGSGHGIGCITGAQAPGWAVQAGTAAYTSSNALPTCGQSAPYVNGCSQATECCSCGTQNVCIFDVVSQIQTCR